MFPYRTVSNLRVSFRHLGRHLGRMTSGVTERLQSGQSMVEYAIIAALIAIVAMAAVQALGVGITGVFQRILGSISNIG
jgi:Flp pilus assembly pilin Flp